MKVLFRGKVIELDDRFAHKFIKAGLAEPVEDKPKPAPKKAPAKKSEEVNG